MSERFAQCPYCGLVNERPSFVQTLTDTIPNAVFQIASVFVFKKIHLKAGQSLGMYYKATNLYKYLCGNKTMVCGNPSCGEEFHITDDPS